MPSSAFVRGFTLETFRNMLRSELCCRCSSTRGLSPPCIVVSSCIMWAALVVLWTQTAVGARSLGVCCATIPHPLRANAPGGALARERGRARPTPRALQSRPIELVFCRLSRRLQYKQTKIISSSINHESVTTTRHRGPLSPVCSLLSVVPACVGPAPSPSQDT